MTYHDLFPDDVRVEIATSDMLDGRLHPREAECVRTAVPKRQREYALGRACAKKALAYYGISDFPLVTGPDRAPVWPNEYVGSITHCKGLTAAAVAKKGPIIGIGIDAEPAAPLDPELIRLVCTHEELQWIRTIPQPAYADWGTVVFSAKETVHKCVNPMSGITLDFLDVVINICRESGQFVARLTKPNRLVPDLDTMVARFNITADHVVTAATIVATQP